MLPFGEEHEVEVVVLPVRFILELPDCTTTLPVPVQPPGAVTVTE